ncbi:Hypothetical protein SRAE_2000482200 [Strongyloides ratti]|uniref:EGF-like domain-containing protein n=1 Tax=Strongyloides ratti TaxID=34506 RepID=A0A090LKI6_STRRB|nr:Hypothetical protein SRAE_2000482200 [Strongyloides ratti]CEF70188.1 Hypothetical protein SRAE_2000482200 [Strongyloides ratti]
MLKSFYNNFENDYLADEDVSLINKHYCKNNCFSFFIRLIGGNTDFTNCDNCFCHNRYNGRYCQTRRSTVSDKCGFLYLTAVKHYMKLSLL